MKLCNALLIFLFIIASPLFSIHAQYEEKAPSETAAPAAKEEGTAKEEGAVEEAPIEEQLTEEEKRWIKEEEAALKELSPEELAKRKQIPHKLTLDAVVITNYTFSDNNESYKIKYHINLGGEINADTKVLKGQAKVATDISGFLAKASAFECILKVSIADVPYEILFSKTSETEADISVTFKDAIAEDWESLCTFLDNSGAKFNTRGTPERWIGAALEKAKPSLSKLAAPFDPDKTTTLPFTIAKHRVEDEPVGSAEIEGTGVITLEPFVPATAEGNP